MQNMDIEIYVGIRKFRERQKYQAQTVILWLDQITQKMGSIVPSLLCNTLKDISQVSQKHCVSKGEWS